MGLIFAVPPTTFDIDHAHALLAGERYAATHEGALPHNPFWRDLEFRYDRNPDAFAIVHRNFKLFFDRLSLNHEIKHEICPHRPNQWFGYMRGPMLCVNESTPCVPVTPQPTHQAVPEPGSVVMASVVVGAWLIAAYFLGRSES